MFIKYEIVVVQIGLTLILVAGALADFSLNVLAENGSPTQTLSLLSGNPLNDLAANENCLSIDQRGKSHLQGSPCNVGAHEYQDALPSTDLQIIPTFSDWQAGSLAFSHGSRGEWDYYLWGGFANSLIKKGDTYYLYYQGSPSYDNQCNSVSHRAIGVATSKDGIHWVKSDQNPVISWSSRGSIEEGAVSSAAWVGADGKIYIYYGANTGSGCNVNTSARLAVSEDGENFRDVGEVLSGSDPNVWGSGDEIFPVGAYSYRDLWYLYYIPNGVPLSRKLGVAIGGSPSNFTQTIGINNSTFPAWGPVSIILDGSDAVLIANPNDGSGLINIYKFIASNPSLVQLYDSYILPGCTQSSVIYESSENRWMMSCRDQNAENYYIKHAYPVTWADTAGVFRPSNGVIFLRNSNTAGIGNIALNYGLPGDYPVVGDWDGDGTATIGVYRNGSFYLRNSNTLGFADLVFAFGTPGDQPIAGNWNGDGVDTIGVYRPSTGQFLLRNSNSSGSPHMSFYLGNVGDVGIAGDWNGDGIDTTGVFRPSNGVIFLKNTNSTGFADIALNYGLPGDRPVTGDWDNDGIDTIGVYRNGQFLLRNSNTIGFADIVFALGTPGDMPIAGNWDGIP